MYGNQNNVVMTVPRKCRPKLLPGSISFGLLADIPILLSASLRVSHSVQDSKAGTVVVKTVTVWQADY